MDAIDEKRLEQYLLDSPLLTEDVPPFDIERFFELCEEYNEKQKHDGK